MNQAIQDFIQCKRIAVVGVSRDGRKFGSAIYVELKKRGYQVFAINPNAEKIGGEPCYPNLTAVKDKVDAVLINIKPQYTGSVLQEAAQLGLKKVWMQQGSHNPQLVEQARTLGLNAVSGKCILMYAPPVESLHSFHRFFAKLFGAY